MYCIPQSKSSANCVFNDDGALKSCLNLVETLGSGKIILPRMLSMTDVRFLTFLAKNQGTKKSLSVLLMEETKAFRFCFIQQCCFSFYREKFFLSEKKPGQSLSNHMPKLSGKKIAIKLN
jgi:hypothetical protein